MIIPLYTLPDIVQKQIQNKNYSHSPERLEHNISLQFIFMPNHLNQHPIAILTNHTIHRHTSHKIIIFKQIR